MEQRTTKRLWLAGLRVGKGLKQKDVAELLGISVSAYTHYELGTRTPTYYKAKKLSEMFDVDIARFYEQVS